MISVSVTPPHLPRPQSLPVGLPPIAEKKKSASSESASLRKRAAKLAIIAVMKRRMRHYNDDSEEKITSLSLLTTTRMTTSPGASSARASDAEIVALVNRQKQPNMSSILARKASRSAMPSPLRTSLV